MPLRKAKGDMYEFITHIWNPVKGRCGYDCSYCYMKKMERFPHIANINRSEPYLDEKELRANLGTGNYIFVCSGCDLFHPDVPTEWIRNVWVYAHKHYPGNKYLWHTKNPSRVSELYGCFRDNDMLCVTIESDLESDASKAPSYWERFAAIAMWKKPWMLTIEPVMDFDLFGFAANIGMNMPVQVNIGADSGRNNLPEPSAEKLNALIDWLEPRTKVHLKENLRRLLPEHGLYEKAGAK